jgi:predicted dehydrogenase
MTTGIAFVGCGYVADLYVKTLPLHPDLQLIGVYDRDRPRAEHYGKSHGVHVYADLQSLLRDERVAIVLNLTNPRSHYEVSRACLEAGKHVYSEKPLAMDLGEARQLVELAAARKKWISCAPCSLLSETAQTLWKALRERAAGAIRLVYAEMDDGMVHRMPYQKWLSDTGAPWPFKDEFEVGCTVEHAGYYAAWLPAFFGPVTELTVWGALQVPDKVPGVKLNMQSPDFTVACMKFESGVVARLTCSILAPHDHRLRIVGDEAIISIEDCWRYRAPVKVHRPIKIRRRVMYLPWKKTFPMVGSDNPNPQARGSAQMDWLRGADDMAAAIQQNRAPHLTPEYCLHVAEIVLAMHNSMKHPGAYTMTTRFEPLEPMAWAR